MTGTEKRRISAWDFWSTAFGSKTASRTKDGHFIRPTTRFRNWVTPDGAPGPSGEGGFAAETGRYHLYVSLSCPWAHRTVIFRKLKGLENVISMSTVSPDMLQGRLDLQQGRGLERRCGQRQEQAVGNLSAGRSEIFRPRQRAGAVGQEAQDDRQQRVVGNHPHAQFGVRRLHQRAHRLLSGDAARPRSTASTTWSIRTSTTASIAPALPPRRRPTSRRSATCSTRSTRWSSCCRSSAISPATRITEADWRLFCTLIRFDAVYYSHFKCNWRHIYEYPNLSNYRARSLSAAGRGRDGQPRADQAALLRQPAASEPDRHRAGRPAARFRRAARSGKVWVRSPAPPLHCHCRA